MEEETKERESEAPVSVDASSEAKETAVPEGEIGKTAAFRKKRKTRLLICLIAAVITLLFLGLSYRHFTVMVLAVVFVLTIAIIALAAVALFRNWETVYKLSITTLYIEAMFLIVFFALSASGLLDTIHSAEDFRDYINNSGGVAEVLFVLANFLQVTIIPIPSTITTTAGALLFEGIWKPLYLTVIGLVVGSMFAFFLGKVFGVRFANWLVGEKTIAKYKEMTKGRDKIVLFYMFIFPFFPDDFLCILAGMTNYTYIGFFFLQVFSRTIGTFVTILITKGIVSIPMEGWWLALWAVIIIAVIFLLIVTIKYSDRIERAAMKLIDKLTFGISDKIRKRREAKKAILSEGADAATTAAEIAESVSEKGIVIESIPNAEDSPSSQTDQGAEKYDHQ